MRLHFGVTVVDTINSWPLRPWVVCSSFGWGLGEEFEVCDGLSAMADGGANAVVACVTTANDDDVFVFGGNVFCIGQAGVEEGFGVLLYTQS